MIGRFSRGAGLIAAALALYVIGGPGVQPAAAAEPPAKPADQKLARATGTYPAVAIVDAAGKSHHLAEFKGKVAVVNLWATWCGPCRKEMPTLAALQRGLGGAAVQIIPVSIDSKAAVDKAKAFIAGNAPLPFYHDDEGALTPAMAPALEGYPTTYIYDRQGRLYGVVRGDSDWSSPKMKALLLTLAKGR